MVDQKKEEKVNTIDLRKVIVRFVFTVLFMATVLFLSAGTLKWLEGWIYMGTSLVLLLGSRYILITKFPETAAERMNAGKKEDTQPWDKVIVPIVAIYLPMLTWVVAGLEKRFGLSANLPLWVQILGIGLYFAGSVFSNWAMFHNRFFSSHVRIQKDRGHEVVKDGPYAWVRHPGYAGGFLAWLVTPMFF